MCDDLLVMEEAWVSVFINYCQNIWYDGEKNAQMLNISYSVEII